MSKYLKLKSSKLKSAVEKLFGLIFPPAEAIYYRRQISAQRLRKFDVPKNVPEKITRKDYLIYAYCSVMVARYLISSYTLHLGVEQYYFRFDIVLEAVSRKGNFDKIAFLLVSSLLLYCIAAHHTRVYRPDLIILNQQHVLINKSCARFWQLYPEFRVQFISRNLAKVWLNCAVNVYRICFRMDDRLKEFDAQNQQSDIRAHARLVVYVMVIEMINIVVFVILSKFTLQYRKFSNKSRSI